MRPRPALHHFQRFLQKRYGPTDGPTDQCTMVPETTRAHSTPDIDPNHALLLADEGRKKIF